MSYLDEYNKWLNSPLVDENTKNELKSISGNDNEIKLRFSKSLDFGTAGLRGIMRAGLNGMNIYTVRYATQGLADLIKSCGENVGNGVTIAYDSRNNSPLFAKEAAKVLAANNIHVNLFESLRPTPELSFALREKGSIAGINITASHNTKEYNGYKVYWSDGAQLPPDHADKVSSSMVQNDIFLGVKFINFEEAESNNLVSFIGEEMDEKYMSQVLKQSVGKNYVEEAGSEIKIIYTPFHGTGYKLVPEILRRMGIKNIITVPEQMIIDGNFPTVKSPNPENVEGFSIAIDMAKKENVDLIIGTDPDGDRCGIVVKNGDKFETLTGNQIGVLLLDYIIHARKSNHNLPNNAAVVKSIVSSIMANKICEDNDIKLFETLTGFKYIGEKIKEFEQSLNYTFIFGFEESNGYLAGTYSRDKDAIVASMLIAEMACYYKTKNMNLYDAMETLYSKYGYFKEKVTSIEFSGYDAGEKIGNIMKTLRETPPLEIEKKVAKVIDFLQPEITGLPKSNVLYFKLEDGSIAIVRPSGTEPKIKLYTMCCSQDEITSQELLNTITNRGVKLLS